METRVWGLTSWEEFLELKGQHKELLIVLKSLKTLYQIEDEPIQNY